MRDELTVDDLTVILKHGVDHDRIVAACEQNGRPPLVAPGSGAQFLGYASWIFEGPFGTGRVRFLVRRVKLLLGYRGFFLEFHADKPGATCPSCGGYNVLTARFCNWCGQTPPPAAPSTNRINTSAPADQETRDRLTDLVVREYRRLVLACRPKASESRKIG